MRKVITVFLGFFAVVTYAQSKKWTGQILSDSIPVAGVFVVNLATEKESITDENGYFKLTLQPNDLLIISHPSYEYQRRLVQAEDLNSDLLLIELIPKPNALEEVVITGTAPRDDLIMRHKDHRKFTPAERQLYTATTGPVDILVNALSGRTERLKKELEVEMNERLLARVETIWEPHYYTETLQVPEIYIRGFQYYLIEDDEFVVALKAKNKTLLQWLASKHAAEYNKIIGH